MKSRGERKEKLAAETTKKQNRSPRSTGVKKITTKGRGQCQKATDVLHSAFDQVPKQQVPSESKVFIDLNKEMLARERNGGQINTSTKFKLQLFPIDERTRIGLEKDGYNPFLELTLKATKKISSVVAHIHAKWGNSNIAEGEPMLFPFSVRLQDLATSSRWTLSDSGIKAGDVYAILRSPTTFRLRYGWFSKCGPHKVLPKSASIDFLKFEHTQKGCYTGSIQFYDGRKQSEVSENGNIVVGSETSLTKEADAKGNNINQTIPPWIDNISNISIGEFLSEVSLQGKIDGCALETEANKQGLHLTPIISDISIGSFLSESSSREKADDHQLVSNGSKLGLEQSPSIWDNSIFALSLGSLPSQSLLQEGMNSHPLETNLSSHDQYLQTSIFDGEDTRNEFNFRKLSSSGNNVRITGGPSTGSGVNSFQFGRQDGLVEHIPRQESKLGFLRCSQFSNEDRSRGLRGIKWNDSFGPFDISLSLSHKASEEP